MPDHTAIADVTEFCRLPRLLENFVMVDGPTRAGKSTAIKILASLARVELERIEEIYDYVGFLHGFGKIADDGAVALLRAYADLHIYNLSLSRNVNCRPGDHSSIFKSARPVEYLRRLFAKDHEDSTGKIVKERPILQQHSHYQMEHINIHFDAFGDALHVIEVLRHPIDLVTAVHGRGYGENVCESLHNIHLGLRHGDTAVHLLTHGWEEEFLHMKPHDRVVRMLHGYQMRSYKTYAALPNKRRRKIRVAVFEDFVSDPNAFAENVAAFLDTHTTWTTAKMIRRAGLPRKISVSERDRAYGILKEHCSRQSLEQLDEMTAIYESRWKG